MKKIAIFSNDKDYKVGEYSNDTIVYYFYIENNVDIEKFINLIDIEEYIIHDKYTDITRKIEDLSLFTDNLDKKLKDLVLS